MKHPDKRGGKDMVYLKELVDRLKCFEHYSLKVKNELAKVIHYDCFTNGRVILQQGRIGEYNRRSRSQRSV